MDELIEAAAKAYYDVCPHVPRGPKFLGYKNWAEIGDYERRNAVEGMRAALTALQSKGWVVVPREPTLEMKQAAWAEEASINEAADTPYDFRGNDKVRSVYKAMLAAAPSRENADGK